MHLADGPSPGGLGFLVLMVLVVTAVLIFLAMKGSLRRMRSHVDQGDFGVAPDDPRADGPAPPPSR